MSHLHPGLISAYNSLTDKHLAGYFSNTRIRRHLQRVGLITRSGRIVPDKEYRTKLMQRVHQRHVRECLAQAIFHKVLDMERVHQIEIKRRLEEFARRERVHKMKVERSKRYEEDLIQILSPRPPTGPRGAPRTQYSVPEGEPSESSESPGSSRPNTAPGTLQRPARLQPITSSSTAASLRRRPPRRHRTAADRRQQPLDATADSGGPQGRGPTSEFSRDISPYCLPVINNFLTPVPPTTQRRERGSRVTANGTIRGRRLRSTNAPRGADANEDPPMLRSSVHQSRVAVNMVYFGKTVHLSRDAGDLRDEVKVFQQHCGGENLCVYRGRLQEGESFQFVSRRHRGFPFSLTFYLNGLQVERISSCCEFRHRRGSRLAGRHKHFGFTGVEAASPCYKCIIAMGLDKKPTPPPPKRLMEDTETETTSSPGDTHKETEEEKEKETEEEDGKERAGSTAEPGTQDMETNVKEEIGDKPRDDYEEDFEADDEGDEGSKAKAPPSSSDDQHLRKGKYCSDSEDADEVRGSRSASRSSSSERQTEDEDTKEDHQHAAESEDPQGDANPTPETHPEEPPAEPAAQDPQTKAETPDTEIPLSPSPPPSPPPDHPPDIPAEAQDAENRAGPVGDTGPVADPGDQGKGHEDTSGPAGDGGGPPGETERAKSVQEKLAAAIFTEGQCLSEPELSDTTTEEEEESAGKDSKQNKKDASPVECETSETQQAPQPEEAKPEASIDDATDVEEKRVEQEDAKEGLQEQQVDQAGDEEDAKKQEEEETPVSEAVCVEETMETQTEDSEEKENKEATSTQEPEEKAEEEIQNTTSQAEEPAEPCDAEATEMEQRVEEVVEVEKMEEVEEEEQRNDQQQEEVEEEKRVGMEADSQREQEAQSNEVNEESPAPEPEEKEGVESVLQRDGEDPQTADTIAQPSGETPVGGVEKPGAGEASAQMAGTRVPEEGSSSSSEPSGAARVLQGELKAEAAETSGTEIDHEEPVEDLHEENASHEDAGKSEEETECRQAGDTGGDRGGLTSVPENNAEKDNAEKQVRAEDNNVDEEGSDNQVAKIESSIDPKESSQSTEEQAEQDADQAEENGTRTQDTETAEELAKTTEDQEPVKEAEKTSDDSNVETEGSGNANEEDKAIQIESEEQAEEIKGNLLVSNGDHEEQESYKGKVQAEDGEAGQETSAGTKENKEGNPAKDVAAGDKIDAEHSEEHNEVKEEEEGHANERQGKDDRCEEEDVEQGPSADGIPKAAKVEDKQVESVSELVEAEESKDAKQLPDKKDTVIGHEGQNENPDNVLEIKEMNTTKEQDRNGGVMDDSPEGQTKPSQPTVVDTADNVDDKKVESIAESALNTEDKRPDTDQTSVVAVETNAVHGEHSADTEEGSKASEEAQSVVFKPEAEAAQPTDRQAAQSTELGEVDPGLLTANEATEKESGIPDVLESEDNRGNLVTDWVTLHQASKYFETFVEPLDDMKDLPSDTSASDRSGTVATGPGLVRTASPPQSATRSETSEDNIEKIEKEREPLVKTSDTSADSTKLELELALSELRSNHSRGQEESEPVKDKQELKEQTEVTTAVPTSEADRSTEESAKAAIEGASTLGKRLDNTVSSEGDRGQEAHTKWSVEDLKHSKTEMFDIGESDNVETNVHPGSSTESSTEIQQEKEKGKDAPENSTETSTEIQLMKEKVKDEPENSTEIQQVKEKGKDEPENSTEIQQMKEKVKDEPESSTEIQQIQEKVKDEPESSTEIQQVKEEVKDEPEENQTTVEEIEHLPSPDNEVPESPGGPSEPTPIRRDDTKESMEIKEVDNTEVTTVTDLIAEADLASSTSDSGNDEGVQNKTRVRSKPRDRSSMNRENKEVQLIEDFKPTVGKDQLSTYPVEETSLFGRSSYPQFTTHTGSGY